MERGVECWEQAMQRFKTEVNAALGQQVLSLYETRAMGIQAIRDLADLKTVFWSFRCRLDDVRTAYKIPFGTRCGKKNLRSWSTCLVHARYS